MARRSVTLACVAGRGTGGRRRGRQRLCKHGLHLRDASPYDLCYPPRDGANVIYANHRLLKGFSARRWRVDLTSRHNTFQQGTEQRTACIHACVVMLWRSAHLAEEPMAALLNKPNRLSTILKYLTSCVAFYSHLCPDSCIFVRHFIMSANIYTAVIRLEFTNLTLAAVSGAFSPTQFAFQQLSSF